MTILDRIKQKAQQAYLGFSKAWNTDLNKSAPGEQSFGDLSSKIRRDPGALSMGRGYAQLPQYTEEMGVGRNPGLFIRGVAEKNPLLNITPGFSPRIGSRNRAIDAFQNTARNESEAKAKRYGGYTGTGLNILAGGLGGASGTGALTLPRVAASIGKSTLTGTGVGGAFAAGDDIVHGRMPTFENIKRGAGQGVENSWMFPATNAITNNFLAGTGSKFIPQLANYTDDAIGAGAKQLWNDGARAGAKKLFPFVGKNILREVAETPAETAVFGAQEFGQSGENRGLAEILANRLPGDLVGNALYGFGMGGIKAGGAGVKAKYGGDVKDTPRARPEIKENDRAVMENTVLEGIRRGIEPQKTLDSINKYGEQKTHEALMQIDELSGADALSKYRGYGETSLPRQKRGVDFDALEQSRGYGQVPGQPGRPKGDTRLQADALEQSRGYGRTPQPGELFSNQKLAQDQLGEPIKYDTPSKTNEELALEQLPKTKGETLYHGTNAEFDEFDASKIQSQSGMADRGFSFSTNKNVADAYANQPRKTKGTPRVIEANVDTSKFPVYDAEGKSWEEATWWNGYKRAGVHQIQDHHFSGFKSGDNEFPKSEGVIFKNIKEVEGGKEMVGDTVIVFDPKNISIKPETDSATITQDTEVADFLQGKSGKGAEYDQLIKEGYKPEEIDLDTKENILRQDPTYLEMTRRRLASEGHPKTESELDEIMAEYQEPQARIKPEPKPAPQPEQSTASVPFMMTHKMRQGLADLGFSKEQISAMKPSEARAILDAQPKAEPKKQYSDAEARRIQDILDKGEARATGQTPIRTEPKTEPKDFEYSQLKDDYYTLLQDRTPKEAIAFLKNEGKYTDAEIGELSNDIKVTTRTETRPDYLKQEPVETTKPSGNEKMLNKKEFERIPTREAQIDYIRRLKQTFNSHFTKLGHQLNQEGITIKDYESGKTSKNIETTKKTMDRFADAIEEVDPTFKRRSNYISRMLNNRSARNVFEEVERGIWIGAEDQKMGNIDLSRQDKIKTEDLEQDWVKLLNAYSDQILNKLYLNRLKGSNKLNNAVLEYARLIKDDISGGKDGKGTGKAKSRKIPDFVGIGNKSSKVEQKSDYKLGWLGSGLRENNNVFKHIGGKFNDSWIKWRDFNTKLESNKKGFDKLSNKEKSDIYYNESLMRKQVLQDFVEQAGKTEFESGTTKDYVNEQIAKEVSKRQSERSLAAKAADLVAGVFYRAHLYLSASTGAKQLLEPTRLPSYYNPDTIAKGTAELTKNPIGESKRLVETYTLSDFDDAFDIKAMTKELEASLKTKGVKSKAVRAGSTAVDTTDKFGFAFLTAGERMKNVYWAAVAEAEGKSQGKTGDELTTHVRNKLFEEANVASRHNRAKVWDNSAARLMFQYSQYPLKNARQLTDAMQGKETRKAVGLFGSQLFNAAAIMAVTGLPARYAFQQLMPGGVGPIVSFTENMAETFNSDWSEESKEARMKRLTKQNLAPGGTQYVRSTEGKQAAKGWNETAAGNVRIFGEPESLPKAAQMFIFGKNASPRVRAAYDKDKQVILSPAETKLFKAEQGLSDTGDIFERKSAEKTNRQVIKNLEEPKEQSFLDKILGGKQEAEPLWTGEMPETRKGREEHTELVNIALDAGKDVPEIELKNAFFKGKDAQSESIEERSDVYKSLKTKMEDEFYTDEQRADILKASGATETQFEYYEMTTKTQEARLQELIPELNKMDNEGMMDFLKMGRTKVGSRYLISDVMLTYLYERDYLTKDEADGLKALNFDEITGEFYFDKAYLKKRGVGGSGGSGGSRSSGGSGGSKKGGLTYSQAKAIFKPHELKYSDHILKNLISTYKGSSGRQPDKAGETLLANILSKRA